MTHQARGMVAVCRIFLWFLGYRNNIHNIKKTLVLKLNLSWITRNTLVLSQEGKGCLYYLLLLFIYFYFIVNHLSIQCGIPPGSDFSPKTCMLDPLES